MLSDPCTIYLHNFLSFPTGIYNEDENSTSEYAHCSDVTWNRDGNSLNYMNLEVPVFSLLNQQEVDFLVDVSDMGFLPWLGERDGGWEGGGEGGAEAALMSYGTMMVTV